jgi:hypothetical protein
MRCINAVDTNILLYIHDPYLAPKLCSGARCLEALLHPMYRSGAAVAAFPSGAWERGDSHIVVRASGLHQTLQARTPAPQE